jgi:hypothetical protein
MKALTFQSVEVLQETKRSGIYNPDLEKRRNKPYHY